MMSTIYIITCFVLPNIVWQLKNRKKLEGKEYKFRHFIWTYIFMVYCSWAIQAAWGMITLWDILSFNDIDIRFIFWPFELPGLGWYVYNFVIFIPLGFLLPLIWENFRDFGKVNYAGWLFSGLIEINQMFGGMALIDEYIMRTWGVMAGYFIWCGFHKIFKKSGEKSIRYCGAEPIIYIGLGMAGLFLLYNGEWFY